MTITALDPRIALVLIDLQKGIVERQLAHPPADIVRNARLLADAFRDKGLPVVLVNVSASAPGRAEQSKATTFPPEFTLLVPELGRQATDITVTKRNWGAFINTDLEAQLRGLGVTGIVVAGIATSIGVESTARQAYELGFNVTLALDAMTDMSAEAHDNSVKRIFPRLGETGSTRDIVALLDGR
ncbi:MAG TPA: isochorismatase family protein [Usitatibacter sp.]|jgi:nicotinamidase-related amidase|nr:isochorismatase family protein [Usitatibacter sp.]